MGSETRGQWPKPGDWYCECVEGCINPASATECLSCGTLRPAPPEAAAPNLTERIAAIMRARDLPDDVRLSEIQDQFTMAGIDVPLRSYADDPAPPSGWRARVEGMKRPEPNAASSSGIALENYGWNRALDAVLALDSLPAREGGGRETFEAWHARLREAAGYPAHSTFDAQLNHGFQMTTHDWLGIAYRNPPRTLSDPATETTE